MKTRTIIFGDSPEARREARRLSRNRYNRRYHAKNKERLNAKRRANRLRNVERERETCRRYDRTHRPQILAAKRLRYWRDPAARAKAIANARVQYEKQRAAR